MLIEKFKRFVCSKVLPIVYDDTLSFIELLYKLTDKINETIQQVNTNTAEIAANRSAIENTSADVTALEGRMTTAEGEITTNEQQIADTRQSYVRTVNGIGVTEQTNNVPVGASDVPLANIPGFTPTNVQAAVSELKTATDTNETAIEGLEQGLDTAEQSIAENAQGIEANTAEISANREAIENTSASVTALAGRVTTAEGEITANTEQIADTRQGYVRTVNGIGVTEQTNNVPIGAADVPLANIPGFSPTDVQAAIAALAGGGGGGGSAVIWVDKSADYAAAYPNDDGFNTFINTLPAGFYYIESATKVRLLVRVGEDTTTKNNYLVISKSDGSNSFWSNAGGTYHAISNTNVGAYAFYFGSGRGVISMDDGNFKIVSWATNTEYVNIDWAKVAVKSAFTKETSLNSSSLIIGGTSNRFTTQTIDEIQIYGDDNLRYKIKVVGGVLTVTQ